MKYLHWSTLLLLLSTAVGAEEFNLLKLSRINYGSPATQIDLILGKPQAENAEPDGSKTLKFKLARELGEATVRVRKGQIIGTVVLLSQPISLKEFIPADAQLVEIAKKQEVDVISGEKILADPPSGRYWRIDRENYVREFNVQEKWKSSQKPKPASEYFKKADKK